MRKTKIKTELLGINQIRGMFYSVPGRQTERLVIYGIGAPLPPDSGCLPDAPVILDFDVDLFVPDFIGFGRSKGSFTPKNCIKTFLELHDAFKNGCLAKNSYQNVARKLKYKEIIFVGRSFSGMYVLLLPRFNPKIDKIGAISPILDYQECGKIKGEETPNQFMKAMLDDGYKHLYRGIEAKIWSKHFLNRDSLRPIDNLNFLGNTRVFIGHGARDSNINSIHSLNFHRKLIEKFPDKKEKFLFKLYQSGDHGKSTSSKAVADFLSWLEIPRKSKKTCKKSSRSLK